MSTIKTAIVTGAAGLVGSETVRHFCAKGWRCIGIDNDMLLYFFGAEASTRWLLEKLLAEFPDQFTTNAVDIRDFAAVCKVFEAAGQVDLVVHTAAQPSHDWAAREPFTDPGIIAGVAQKQHRRGDQQHDQRPPEPIPERLLTHAAALPQAASP